MGRGSMSSIAELRRLLAAADTVELDECVGIDLYEPRSAYLPEQVEPLLEALPALLEAAEALERVAALNIHADHGDGHWDSGPYCSACDVSDDTQIVAARAALEKLR